MCFHVNFPKLLRLPTTFTYRIHLVAAAVMTLFLRQVKPFHENKNGLIFQQDYL